jgi:protein involved in polysaccharide export with SLBB domain
MNVMKKPILSFLLLLLVCLSGYSQVNWTEMNNLQTLNIDDLTNEQLTQFKTQVQQKNLTEADAIQILKTKGLTEDQAQKLSEKLQKIQIVKTSTEKFSDTKTQIAEKVSVPIQEINDRDLSIYGSELFTRSSLVFEPNIRIATPSSYVVGPDDELIVHVYGFSEMKYELTVNEQGEVYIQNVGPVFVSGLTIEQVSQKLTNKLGSTIYRAINQGGTKVQVRLGKMRSIRVTVLGEAFKPGTYTVSSLTTLFNLLYLCGGPSNRGSYRQIEVIRKDKLFRVADLYAFLTKGTQGDNVLLQEGDIIRIPYCQQRVEISGAVHRAGKYEMKPSEHFDDLLNYCGGFSELAYRKMVSVSSISDKDRKIIDIKDSTFNYYQTKPGDRFFVYTTRDALEDKIVITGAVFRPGQYETNSTDSLSALFEKAGGVRDDAYLQRANLFRTDVGKQWSMLSFSIDSLIKKQLDIHLQKGDSIHVYSVFDFRDEEQVFVEGSVRKSGKYLWRKNMTVRELILEAGGITATGDSTWIEITRKFSKSESMENNGMELQTFRVNLSGSDSVSSTVLNPADVVQVKLLPGLIRNRRVLVIGEAMVPGKYPLLNSGDRIIDLIGRINGLKRSVDSNYVTIRRKRETNQSNLERELLMDRLESLDENATLSQQTLTDEIDKSYDLISLNLKNVLENPTSPNNVLLEDQDIIIFNKKTSMVRISGEVLHPMFMPIYPGKSMRFYIKKSGGFLKDARKSASYAVLPNGQVKRVKHFLFFKSYPKVTGKTDIIVPKKQQENKKGFSLGELAILASTLSVIANVIINLTK